MSLSIEPNLCNVTAIAPSFLRQLLRVGFIFHTPPNNGAIQDEARAMLHRELIRLLPDDEAKALAKKAGRGRPSTEAQADRASAKELAALVWPSACDAAVEKLKVIQQTAMAKIADLAAEPLRTLLSALLVDREITLAKLKEPADEVLAAA